MGKERDGRGLARDIVRVGWRRCFRRKKHEMKAKKGREKKKKEAKPIHPPISGAYASHKPTPPTPTHITTKERPAHTQFHKERKNPNLH
jgi:hypothetical protein